MRKGIRKCLVLLSVRSSLLLSHNIRSVDNDYIRINVRRPIVPLETDIPVARKGLSRFRIVEEVSVIPVSLKMKLYARVPLADTVGSCSYRWKSRFFSYTTDYKVLDACRSEKRNK